MKGSSTDQRQVSVWLRRPIGRTVDVQTNCVQRRRRRDEQVVASQPAEGEVCRFLRQMQLAQQRAIRIDAVDTVAEPAQIRPASSNRIPSKRPAVHSANTMSPSSTPIAVVVNRRMWLRRVSTM